MKSFLISKDNKVLRGRIRLPASKSISNRMLMIQALADAPFPVENLSTADDTLLLKKLLCIIRNARNGRRVTELDAGNAGTVYRFLTALLSITPGSWMLTGSERMKQRPVGVLAEALMSIGARIDYLGKPGYPPLLIRGNGITGKEVTIDPGISSQYASALMLIAPKLPDGLTINLKGKIVSSPYVEMTSRLMKQCGIRITAGQKKLQIMSGNYVPETILVEADWSSAAFWYQTAVFCDEVDLFLEGLTEESLQGDSVLPRIYKNFGILTGFFPDGIRLQRIPRNVSGFFHDFSDNPDLVQAIVATCAGLGIRGRFEGVKSLMIKETDRLRAMKNEIEKLGTEVRTSGSHDPSPFLELSASRNRFREGVVFETYADHRMAMALAPLAVVAGPLRIRNPEVVVKSYPEFWDHLKILGFSVQ